LDRIEVVQLLLESANVGLNDFLEHLEVQLDAPAVVSELTAQKGFRFDLLVFTTDSDEVLDGETILLASRFHYLID
jgi:hypothetical protein